MPRMPTIRQHGIRAQTCRYRTSRRTTEHEYCGRPKLWVVAVGYAHVKILVPAAVAVERFGGSSCFAKAALCESADGSLVLGENGERDFGEV